MLHQAQPAINVEVTYFNPDGENHVVVSGLASSATSDASTTFNGKIVTIRVIVPAGAGASQLSHGHLVVQHHGRTDPR